MEGTLFRAVRTPLSQAELHQHLDSSFRRFPPASPFGSGRSPRQRREASLTGTRGAGSHGLRERMIIARKWTYAKQGQTRRRVVAEIRQLVRRMAEENPRWGYTRIQGALKNLGHRVGRSTIARILRTDGIPPVPERPTSWQTFLWAHLGEIAAADFFTTEVWTWRGLVTFNTVFVIDLASRRIQILGSTPYPDERFRCQIVRNVTGTDADGYRVLICDRDAKWGEAARARLHDAGIRVVQTPYLAQMPTPSRNGSSGRSKRNV